MTLSYLYGAKNFASVRYAYVWCERLKSRDPSMRQGTPMEELYFDYAARARQEKSQLAGDVIQPVHIDTWYEIFFRVCGRL